MSPSATIHDRVGRLEARADGHDREIAAAEDRVGERIDRIDGRLWHILVAALGGCLLMLANIVFTQLKLASISAH